MTKPATAPVVSVVMPTYRRLDTFSEALESVLAQSYPHFEVVVTDNSASEAVRRLAEGYGDPRVRYRHNGGNIGLQPNMMAGYAAGRGQLLTTLHDDDLWEPAFLERLVPPMLDDPGLSIAFCDYWLMGPDGRVDPAASDRNSRREGRAGLAAGAHDDGLRLAVLEQSIQVSYAAVFRRSLDLSAVPGDLAPLYDLWIAYLATVDGGRVWYCPERLTRYRHHVGSATAANPFASQEATSFARFLADPRTARLAAALRRKQARALTRAGLRLLLDLGDAAGARQAARESLRTARTPLAAALLAGATVPGAAPALGRARAWQHRRTMTLVAPAERATTGPTA